MFDKNEKNRNVSMWWIYGGLILGLFLFLSISAIDILSQLSKNVFLSFLVDALSYVVLALSYAPILLYSIVTDVLTIRSQLLFLFYLMAVYGILGHCLRSIRIYSRHKKIISLGFVFTFILLNVFLLIIARVPGSLYIYITVAY